MKHYIKDYFKDKTAEQTFSLCLLVFCFGAMLFCAIVRLCGGLWFTADLTKVNVPSEFWQTVILALLMIFELTFVYKILCRCVWSIAIIISIIHTTISAFIPTELATNIFNLVAILIFPVLYTKEIVTFIDCVVLYAIEILYSALFLVGRIGEIDINGAYNFTYNVIGCIDFKLFIACIYLYIKNFGGIKLWKNQKRLLLQNVIKKNEML